MRVAVNTRLLIKNKMDGIGRYAFEILKRVTQNNPTVEFHFIFDRQYNSDEFLFSKNIIPHVLKPKTRHPILWYIWLEIQLPCLLKKIQPDMFFSPDGFLPRYNTCPSITTIHDINFEHRPKDLRWSHSLFYRTYFKKYAQLSNHIITVSNYSKQDIAKTYNINVNKISVVYNGVSEKFNKTNYNEQIKIKQKYSQNQDFFIFIGSLHKRKNLKNLLLAFNDYKVLKGKYKLIIIGEEKWIDHNTKKIYQNLLFKEDVIFLGRVEDSELFSILSAAKALCFVSLFEGFGLPIIEAMRASIPVIASNTSAMPEICNNASRLVNPYNIADISKSLLEIEKNPKYRLELIKKGDQRVKDFNWDKSAIEIWKIIESTLKKCT